MTQQNTTTRIALVDDHNILRDGLATAIDSLGECKVTIQASNGKELIAALKSSQLPQLVILDLNMPQMGGFDTALWLRNNYPEIPILILTMYDSGYMLIQLLKMGVRGFLKKDIHPAELHRAIKSTIQTGYYYTGSTAVTLARLLQNSDSTAPLGNTISLTEPELHFLQLASTEMTYKEISSAMEVSPRTVDGYRDTLFGKLNVKSRIGLVLFAIQNGIVRLEY